MVFVGAPLSYLKGIDPRDAYAGGSDETSVDEFKLYVIWKTKCGWCNYVLTKTKMHN